MLLPAAIALLLLVAFRNRDDGPQQPTPATAPPSPSSSQGADPSGLNPSAALGTVGALATTAGTVVGVLKGAGLFAGGSTAVATGGTAAGGSGTAAAGSGAAGTAAAGGGASVGATIGVAAIILAVEILIAYGVYMLTESAAGWQRWIGKAPETRLAGLWFLEEQNVVESITDPAVAGLNDPKTGKPAGVQLVTARKYVGQLQASGYRVDTYVPTEFELPAAEVTRLYRAARYLAYVKIRAYNAFQYAFYRNAYNVGDNPPGRNGRGLSPGAFEAWAVAEVFDGEQWADELGFRLSASAGLCEAALRGLVGPNFDRLLQDAEFQGRAMAITDCAITGWPWLQWPGDYQFCFQLMLYGGLAPEISGWKLEEHTLEGGRKWIAIDPATGIGIDLQGSRAAHSAKCYPPQLLKRFLRPAVIPFTPAPAQADVARIVVPSTAEKVFASSGSLATKRVLG